MAMGLKWCQFSVKKLLSWLQKQSKKVKLFLFIITAITLLMTIKFTVYDHNYLFVMAEATHFIGLLLLIYKFKTLNTCSVFFCFLTDIFEQSGFLKQSVMGRSNGLSLKSQVLTVIFLGVRLYCSFIMEGDIHTVLDLITFMATLWVIYMMKFKLKASYRADLDNMSLYYVIAPAAILALFVHPGIRSYALINRMLWAFCVYLESISVLPQLRLMQNVQIIEPFSAHYVFALGIARFLGCAHWIIQLYDHVGSPLFLDERGYFWIPMVFLAEIIQTFILADFCYYYIKSVMSGQLIITLPKPV